MNILYIPSVRRFSADLRSTLAVFGFSVNIPFTCSLSVGQWYYQVTADTAVSCGLLHHMAFFPLFTDVSKIILRSSDKKGVMPKFHIVLSSLFERYSGLHIFDFSLKSLKRKPRLTNDDQHLTAVWNNWLIADTFNANVVTGVAGVHCFQGEGHETCPYAQAVQHVNPSDVGLKGGDHVGPLRGPCEQRPWLRGRLKSYCDDLHRVGSWEVPAENSIIPGFVQDGVCQFASHSFTRENSRKSKSTINAEQA